MWDNKRPMRRVRIVILTLALATAAAFAQVDPEFAAHVRAGLAAREAGRLDEAARELRAAAEISSALPEVFLTLGEVEHRRQQWPAAAAAFEKALEMKPDVAGARPLLGLDYLMMGRYEEAIQTLQQARQEPSPKPESDFWLGLALLETGRIQQAIPHLEAARTADPTDPDRLFYLGRAYQRAAAQVQGELLAVAPDSARAHLAMAEDHAYNGRPDLAVEEYQRTAEIDPTMPGVRGAIAELLASDGKYDEAAARYEEELAISPYNPTVHYRYAVVLQKLGREDEAAEHLALAVDGDPRIVEAWAELGKALLRQKKLPDAEKALLKALSMESTPDVARTAHYQLGMLYRQTGDVEKSKEHLTAFQKLRQIENEALQESPPAP